jgi:hypothetical protein
MLADAEESEEGTVVGERWCVVLLWRGAVKLIGLDLPKRVRSYKGLGHEG